VPKKTKSMTTANSKTKRKKTPTMIVLKHAPTIALLGVRQILKRAKTKFTANAEKRR